ncbi:MAG: hypothetical protein ACHQX3_00490 [Nitrospirales bacterium]
MNSYEPTPPPPPYEWKVGDVFTDGTYRWKVESIQGDKAVLRSCSTAWAYTIPLTYSEWQSNMGLEWRLEDR